jgi:biopolymer transport protein ExbD
MRPRPFRKSDREPTITLINVVFLMLIFFMVAGTIAPATDARLTLVEADDLIAAPPPDGVLVLADGTLVRAGMTVTVAQAAASGSPVRLVPDRALPAPLLVAIGRDLRAAGASSVVLVAERRSP